MVPGTLWRDDLLRFVANKISSSMSSCQRLQVFMVWFGEVEVFVVLEHWQWTTSDSHSSGCWVLKAAIKFSTNLLTESLCLVRHCIYSVPSLCVDEASMTSMTVFWSASLAFALMRKVDWNVSVVYLSFTAVLF